MKITCPICKENLEETITENRITPNSVTLTKVYDSEGKLVDDLNYDYDYSGDFEGRYYCDWCESYLSDDSDEVIKILKGEIKLTKEQVLQRNKKWAEEDIDEITNRLDSLLK